MPIEIKWSLLDTTIVWSLKVLKTISKLHERFDEFFEEVHTENYFVPKIILENPVIDKS